MKKNSVSLDDITQKEISIVEANDKLSKLEKEKAALETKLWDKRIENDRLKKQLKDFEKIKAYLGIDKIKELLQTIADKTKKQKER